MSIRLRDFTPTIDRRAAGSTGAVRHQMPSYVTLTPPCSNACPAGEDIRAWLAEAQAGNFRRAWEILTEQNPMPAVHGRIYYHPCESSCNRGEVDAPVSIHAVERYLGDLRHVAGQVSERLAELQAR